MAMSVDDFVARWGLNATAVQALNELDPDVRDSVVQDFIPRENTRNPSDLLVAFARSRARSAKTGVPGAGMVSRHDVEEFIQRWGLNAESYATLLQLPINVLDGVLRAFSPKEEARDINNMFQAFARSRLNNAMIAYQQGYSNHHQAQQAEAAGEAMAFPPQVPAQAPALMNPYAQFQGMAMMPQQQLMMQQMAAAQNPHMMALQQLGGLAPGAMNPMAAYNAQTPVIGNTQVAAAGPLQIQEFVRRHHLGEISKMLLESLSQHHPQVLDRLILEYHQADITRDPDENFVASWQPRAVKSLQERYGLNPESVAYFKTMDIALQAAVVKEFSPRDTSVINDMNSLFGSFMRSRVRTAQAAAVAAMEQFSQSIYGETGLENQVGNEYLTMPTIGTIGTTEVSRKRPLDSISGFITQWNLSDSSENLMRTLTPMQQAEVIERFAPKHNTRDVDALFKKFVSSVQMKG